jgi:lipoprotein NlpI
MKWKVPIGGILLLFPTVLLSQMVMNPQSPASRAAQENNGRVVSVAGRVASDDGSAPAEKATVVLECGHEERARTSTDGRGEFIFSLTLIDSVPVRRFVPEPPGFISAQSWSDCELYGDAAGYRSERVHMFGVPDGNVVQAGTIALHPLATENSFAVSVTSLAAPDKAKRAFEKGREQEKKGKWAAACDYFKRAIEAYPRYALAWLELGRAQVKQSAFSEAQESFHQAVTQDSRFMDGYVELARLAAEQKQWKDLADATEHLVQLWPDSSPQYWFLNSAANFNMGDVQRAETSAARGLRLDTKHQVPQLEHLYATILASRQDYDAATEHIKTYLRLSPHADDAQAAQDKLVAWQKLAQSATTASR